MIEYGRVEHYEDKTKTGLYIRGHANYVKKGHDPVCAAVSAIGQTAMAGCMVFDDRTHVKQCRKGYMVFVCKDNTETNAIIRTALMGLNGVKKQYPQCFK